MRHSYWICVALLLPLVANAADERAATVDEPIVAAPLVLWPSDYQPLETRPVLPSEQFGLRSTWSVPLTELPALDVAKLEEEDAANADPGMPPRIGIGRPLTAPVEGMWYDLPAGGQIWTAAVQSDGAVDLRLRFEQFNLPEGATLYVYEPGDNGRVMGPYQATGPHSNGDFWAGTIPGEIAYIEYYTPESTSTTVPFAIGEIGHMYRGIADGDGDDPVLRGTLDCMGDVMCYPDWVNLSYAVGRITMYVDGRWAYCSGTLIATTAGDLTPLFLISAHCISDQAAADTAEVLWFYQHSSCNGSFMTTQTTDDALLLGTAGYNGSIQGADWTLLMLRGVLPTGVNWSGWTTGTPATGSHVGIVHHPDASWKRYTRGRRYYSSTYFNRISYNNPDAPDYDIGAIYYGSSGGGVWTEDSQLLFGNASFVDNTPGCDNLNTSAYYGRFSSYYSLIDEYLASGADDELENNDTCATATSVTATTYTDLVVKSVAPDWYRITVPADSGVQVQLSFQNTWGNIDAKLYNSCGGTEVASATSTTANTETLTYTNAGSNPVDVLLNVYLANDTRNEYNMTIALTCIVPQFLEQPTSQYACLGDMVQFSVAVDIPNPTYQWRIGTTPLVDDGVHISGAQTPTLTLTDLVADDAANYNCYVMNQDDGCVGTSSNAVLTVGVPITFTDQPDDVEFTPGQTIILAVTVSGPSPVYSWYHDGVLVEADARHVGVTSQNLLIVDSIADDAGEYVAVVSNDCGPRSSAPANVYLPSTICAGDANCDGEVNFFDIDPFVVALTASNDPTAWQIWLASNGYTANCDFLNNDTNGDSSVDFFDIDPFVALLSSGATCP